jgi:hypothetical protein
MKINNILDLLTKEPIILNIPVEHEELVTEFLILTKNMKGAEALFNDDLITKNELYIYYDKFRTLELEVKQALHSYKVILYYWELYED